MEQLCAVADLLDDPSLTMIFIYDEITVMALEAYGAIALLRFGNEEIGEVHTSVLDGLDVKE